MLYCFNVLQQNIKDMGKMKNIWENVNGCYIYRISTCTLIIFYIILSISVCH